MGGMQHLAWSQFPFTALCKTARHASPGAHQHGLHTSQGLVMSHQVQECMAVPSHKVSTDGCSAEWTAISLHTVSVVRPCIEGRMASKGCFQFLSFRRVSDSDNAVVQYVKSAALPRHELPSRSQFPLRPPQP